MADIFNVTSTSGTLDPDNITGTDGNDNLSGDAGADSIFGSNGDDILIGGLDNDTLVGGAGNDVYVIDNINDVVIETDSSSNNGTFIIQPGPEGMDTSYGTVNGTGGWPNEYFLANGGYGDTYTTLLQFDLNGAPVASGASNVVLWMYSLGGTVNQPGIQLQRVTSPWTEDGVHLGADPGGIFFTAMPDIPTHPGWVSVDITSLYQAWKDGTYVNYGIRLEPTYTNNTGAGWASSDNVDPGVRPKLVITSAPVGDTVLSSVSYTISANVENLVLSGSDAIDGTGNSGNNSLTGNNADNHLSGSEGRDTLTGGLGNDTIDGGTGIDTAVFAGVKAGYQITFGAGSEVTVTDIDVTNGDEGTNTLVNVERLQFADNVSLPSGQYAPVAATLPNGDFVVTWTSNNQDGDGHGIYAQHFNAEGAAIGIETRVNSTTTGDQSEASIATLAGGGYVVTWMSYSNEADRWDVYAQLFDTDSAPLGNEFRVNTTTTYNQYYPDVAPLADGGFAVTWSSKIDPENRFGIQVQRYDANGNPVGGEIAVQDNSGNPTHEHPAIAGLADGGFVVTWQEYVSLENLLDIYIQRYGADGATIGTATQVNTFPTGNQQYPAITALKDGGYVVTWESENQDGSGFGIYAQRYTATGIEAGKEIQVNSTSTGDQHFPAITALTDGGYVISWTSNQGGSGYDIYAQRYDANGSAIDGEILLNTESRPGEQQSPTITALAGGAYAAVWMNNPLDGSGWSIAGKIMMGAAGNDVLIGGLGDDIVRGFNGNDVLEGGAGQDTLEGGTGNDHLYSGSGNDYVDAGAGNDEIVGGDGAGDDVYIGGTGVDRVKYTSAVTGITVNLKTGNASGNEIGNDTLSGIENIIGGQSDDLLVGDDRDNVIDGFAGNDTLDGGAGADSMAGGQGGDTYVVDKPGDKVVELGGAGAGIDTVVSSITYSLVDTDGSGPNGGNVENLTLTGSANINATGNALDNALVGNEGNNKLTGGLGNDSIEGGGGNDTITSGVNSLKTGQSDQDTVSAGDGNDNVTGGAGNDSLDGGAGNDTIDGGTDNDTINGGAGRDSLIAGAGNDSIHGDSGNDTINGGDGDDAILGDKGNDLLTGGKGADIFIISTTDGAGSDVITDFSATTSKGVTVAGTSDTLTVLGHDSNDVVGFDRGDFQVGDPADGKGVLITFNSGGSVLLKNVSLNDLVFNDATNTFSLDKGHGGDLGNDSN